MSAGLWILIIGTAVLAIAMAKDLVYDLRRGRR
ncbi:hypothetical protein HNR71_002340 [Kribbella sandramycini]|uniref:Uncharacterized protein n=1 Tax=Kribbella sandramycini TaxID=60450 RepID=A0A841SBK6_9ACTN|nr:hypothetical protein [Kribbella sandramycini]